MRLNNLWEYLHEIFPDYVPRGRGDNLRTIFDFDPEYLRNGFIYRNRTYENNLINRNHFHVRQKKFSELWSTNKKVLEVHTDPPKRTLFDRRHFQSPQKILIVKIKN